MIIIHFVVILKARTKFNTKNYQKFKVLKVNLSFLIYLMPIHPNPETFHG